MKKLHHLVSRVRAQGAGDSCMDKRIYVYLNTLERSRSDNEIVDLVSAYLSPAIDGERTIELATDEERAAVRELALSVRRLGAEGDVAGFVAWLRRQGAGHG